VCACYPLSLSSKRRPQKIFSFFNKLWREEDTRGREEEVFFLFTDSKMNVHSVVFIQEQSGVFGRLFDTDNSVSYYLLRYGYELELREILYKAGESYVWIHLIVSSTSLERHLEEVRTILHRYAHERAKLLVTVDNTDNMDGVDIDANDLARWLDVPYMYDEHSMEMVDTTYSNYDEPIDVVFMVTLWGGAIPATPAIRQKIGGTTFNISDSTNFTTALFTNYGSGSSTVFDTVTELKNAFLTVFENDIITKTRQLSTAGSSYANTYTFSTKPKTKLSRVFEKHTPYIGSGPQYAYFPLFNTATPTYDTLRLVITFEEESPGMGDDFVVDLMLTDRNSKYVLPWVTNSHMHVSFDHSASDFVQAKESDAGSETDVDYVHYRVVNDYKLVIYSDTINTSSATSVILYIKIAVPTIGSILSSESHLYNDTLSIACAGYRIDTTVDITLDRYLGETTLATALLYPHNEQALEWFHNSSVDLTVHGRIDVESGDTSPTNIVYLKKTSDTKEIVLATTAVATTAVAAGSAFRFTLPEGSYNTFVKLMDEDGAVTDTKRIVLYGTEVGAAAAFVSNDVVTNVSNFVSTDVGSYTDLHHRYDRVPRYAVRDLSDGIEQYAITKAYSPPPGSPSEIDTSGLVVVIKIKENTIGEYQHVFQSSTDFTSGSKPFDKLACVSNNSRSVHLALVREEVSGSLTFYMIMRALLDPRGSSETIDIELYKTGGSTDDHTFILKDNDTEYEKIYEASLDRNFRKYYGPPITNRTNNVLEYRLNDTEAVYRLVIEKPVRTCDELMLAIAESPHFSYGSFELNAASGSVTMLFKKDDEDAYRDRTIAPLLGKFHEDVTIDSSSAVIDLIEDEKGWFRYTTSMDRTGSQQNVKMYFIVSIGTVTIGGYVHVYDWRTHYWKPPVAQEGVSIETHLVQEGKRIRAEYIITIDSGSDRVLIDLGCFHHFRGTQVYINSNAYRAYDHVRMTKESFQELELVKASVAYTADYLSTNPNDRLLYRASSTGAPKATRSYHSETISDAISTETKIVVKATKRSVYDGKLCLAYCGHSDDDLIVFNSSTTDSMNVMISTNRTPSRTNVWFFIEIELPSDYSDFLVVIYGTTVSATNRRLYYLQPDYSTFTAVVSTGTFDAAITNIIAQASGALNPTSINSDDYSPVLSNAHVWACICELTIAQASNNIIGVPDTQITLPSTYNYPHPEPLSDVLAQSERGRFLLFTVIIGTVDATLATTCIIHFDTHPTNLDFSVYPIEMHDPDVPVFVYTKTRGSSPTPNLTAQFGKGYTNHNFNLWLCRREWNSADRSRGSQMKCKLYQGGTDYTPTITFVGSFMDR
jgi:hypothetical protein